jgi:hypothetical protein
MCNFCESSINTRKESSPVTPSINFQVIYVATDNLSANTRSCHGAPTSSIFSELFLQYMQHTAPHDILIHHHILGYFRYFDYVLIVYDASLTDIDVVLKRFNTAIFPLEFTIKKEHINLTLRYTVTHRNSLMAFKANQPLHTPSSHLLPVILKNTNSAQSDTYTTD